MKKRKIFDAQVTVRLQKKVKKELDKKSNEYGGAGEVIRYLIKAFNKDEVRIQKVDNFKLMEETECH